MVKKTWIAVLLNFFISGSGYLYLKKKMLFGSLVLTGEIFFLLSLIFTKEDFIRMLLNPFILIGGLIWVIAICYDSYKINQK